jgi:hypothetical protein
MIGDQADIQSRLQSVVPPSWFGDTPTNETATLTGFANIASGIYNLIAFAKLQMRRLTASGMFLDLYAADYLGLSILRRTGEVDDLWRARIGKEILRERVTRKGVVQAVADLTGKTPIAFEPWNTGDTGVLSSRVAPAPGNGTMGFGSRVTGAAGAGLLGSRKLKNVAFMTIQRPGIFAISNIGGMASRNSFGGVLSVALGGFSTRTTTSTATTGSFAFITRAQAQGVISDQDIYNTVNVNKPTGVIVVVKLI